MLMALLWQCVTSLIDVCADKGVLASPGELLCVCLGLCMFLKRLVKSSPP